MRIIHDMENLCRIFKILFLGKWFPHIVVWCHMEGQIEALTDYFAYADWEAELAMGEGVVQRQENILLQENCDCGICIYM